MKLLLRFALFRLNKYSMVNTHERFLVAASIVKKNRSCVADLIIL